MLPLDYDKGTKDSIRAPRECEMIGDKDSIRAPTKLFQIELKLLSAGVFQRLLKLYKVANPKKNRAGLRYTERFKKSPDVDPMNMQNSVYSQVMSSPF